MQKKNVIWFKELLSSLSVALILAIIFRSFLYEPFHIPSGSMKPTLLVGDYVFVSKYSYGYSRYSLPFGFPIFEDRVFEDKPERGDIIVFKLPINTNINYIKRLIGLPGDRIQVKNGQLFINGVPTERKQIQSLVLYDKFKRKNNIIDQYIETLPNGVSYKIYDDEKGTKFDNTVEFVVPEDNYFFMGDNRDHSQDSRAISKVGFVPKENLLGPTKMVFFSSSGPIWKIWKWFSSIRFNRIFSSLEYSEDGNE